MSLCNALSVGSVNILYRIKLHCQDPTDTIYGGRVVVVGGGAVDTCIKQMLLYNYVCSF